MKLRYIVCFAFALILTVVVSAQNRNVKTSENTRKDSNKYFDRYTVDLSENNSIKTNEILLSGNDNQNNQIKISAYCDNISENNVQVYYKVFSNDWSNWKKLRISDNQESNIPERFFFEATTEKGNLKKIQFKSSKSKGGKCTFKIFYPLKTVRDSNEKINTSITLKNNACSQPEYVKKSDWCELPTCINSNPKPNITTHIAVHHSANFELTQPYSAEVFSIWDNHVNDRNRDDIGYNWLIAPDGVIYEGRGNSIEGANFSCMNSGITGICLLGNFSSVSTSSPTSDAINSLIEQIKWEASIKKINIEKSSFHPSSELVLNHIMGHRDGNASINSCTSTICPGQNLYDLLPTIRNLVASSSCYKNSLGNCINNAFAGQDKTINKGESIQLQGSGGSSYLWSPTKGLSNPNNNSQISVFINHLPIGLYIIKIPALNNQSYKVIKS